MNIPRHIAFVLLLIAIGPAYAYESKTVIADGWTLTDDKYRCSADPTGQKSPSLYLVLTKENGRIAFSLQFIPIPDPQVDYSAYDANVAVSLNGNPLFDLGVFKTAGTLDFADFRLEHLAALGPPGEILFDITGKQKALHEPVRYQSRGLQPAVDFFKKCLSQR